MLNNIKNLYIRLRVKLIILFSLIVFIIGLTNIYYITVVTPVSNDECIWTPVNVHGKQMLVFEKVKAGGVTWNAGIRNGDYLLAINNVPATNDQQMQLVLNKLKAGSFATYTIKRENVTCNVNIYIKKLILFNVLSFNLLAFLWFCISFVVIMSKPEGEVQRLFYKIGAFFVLGLSGTIFNYHTNNPDSAAFYNLYHFLGFLVVVPLILVPFYFMKFFMLFPLRHKFTNYKHFNHIYYSIPVTYLIIIFILGRMGGSDGIINLIVNYNLLIGITAGFAFLIINYRRIKTKQERKPVFVISAGFFLGIIALLYTNFVAPIIAGSIYNSPYYYAPIIMLVIIPISFAYSIFKYQLMDVSEVVKNTIVYGVATVALAGIYFVTIYLLGQSVSMAISPEYRNILAGFVFIIFAMAFQSTKDRLQEIITKQFYPEQFAFRQMIMKFSNEVSGVVGLENILINMEKTFVNSLRLKQFAILLKDESNGKYELRSCHGINAANIEIDSTRSNLENFLKEKSVQKDSIIIEQADFPFVFPDESELLVDQKIFTVVPLVIKSKVIGLLLFGLKYSGSQFAGRDAELLTSAANQSAVAIENARLYKLESLKLKIEIDLDLARKIQEGLLPSSIPQITKFDISGKMIPAMQVGGDYFDIIKVSDSKFFVFVGDVSGKGLSASLYMAKLQTMLQLVCDETKTPKTLLTELNRRLYDSLEKNWFITMSAALFDSEKKTVSFCRAGHVPIAVVNGDQSNVYQPIGIGLGLEKGKIFGLSLEEMEIPLKKDDIWVFVSDGITEAMDESKNLFGMEKLLEVVSSAENKQSNEIMSELTNSIIQYRGKADQNDDITAVIVKIV